MKQFDKRNLTLVMDFYELTMSNGYFAEQDRDTWVAFDVFYRKNPDGVMAHIAEAEGEITGCTAFEAMKQGDEYGKAVVLQYARYLADGIVSIENIFQPEIIAVGGGVSNAGEALFGPVREYVNRTGYNKFMPKTKIVKAVLGNDAGIIGAAMVARNGIGR